MPEIKNVTPWERNQTLKDILITVISLIIINFLLFLPYSLRLSFSGWIFTTFLGPLTGRTKVALEQIQLVYPNKSKMDSSKIANKCLNNIGRTLIENFSPNHFIKNQLTTITGPGIKLIKDAETKGKAIILATGHFGNYEAPRNALLKLDLETGGMYRPMNNKTFNKLYVDAMQKSGKPIFSRGSKGTKGMIKHLRQGGRTIILFDQKMREGKCLNFLGQPSMTILSPAELALKFDAHLIPFFGIRNEDGFSFTNIFEEPIPHTDAKTMSQQLNDRLTARIHDNPEQWFWVHRRWKS